MKVFLKIVFGVLSFFITTGSLSAQGAMCEDIEPFCAGDQLLTFPNSNYTNSSQITGEPGPDYGCLEAQPYPAWFFLQIEEAGNLNFTISQFSNSDGTGAPLDVDFIVWGPFERGDEYCNPESLSFRNEIDCSYLPDAVETMSIPNAQANEIYVVLITNFQMEPGFISLQQTNSGGVSTDCTILDSDLGDNIAVCGEDEYVLDGTTDEAEIYEWYVFDETSGEYEQIPNADGPRLTVTENGDYRLIVKDLVGASEDQDNVTVNFYDTPQIGGVENLSSCAEGVENIDLSQTESQLIQPNSDSGDYEAVYYESSEDAENDTEIDQPQNYPFEVGSVVYVRVRHIESGCLSEVRQFELVSFDLPEFQLPETSVFCVDLDNNLLNPVSIGEDLGEEYSYEWFVGEELVAEDPVVTFDQFPASNEISLIITHIDSGCDVELNTTAVAVSRPESVSVEISGSDFGDGYTVSVITEGGIGSDFAELEYRLDNGGWQDSNVFNEVPPGNHTVSVREKNSCGSLSSDSFFLVGYPRFFTPNSDGYNDTWNLITDNNITIRELYVFDRYGKLLKQLKPGASGWDGTYNGKDLPADDYWFRVEFVDEKSGSLQEYMSNFTLIR